MKKLLIGILLIAALLLSGCGKQEVAVVETEPDREIDICLSDMYGVITVLEEDMEGNVVPGEYGGISVLGAAGEPIANGFKSSGYSDILPVLEGDTFEGWMECVYDDELGSYVIVSETLYSTEELMAMPVPEAPVEYFAKWAGISAEEYFAYDAEAALEDSSTSGVFDLCANGGVLHFLSRDNQEYTCAAYGFSLEKGQSLNDVMGAENDDSLIGVSKEGATFTGWSVYVADSIFLSYEPVESENMLCLVFDENDYNGVLYVLLRDAVAVEENMSTEELCNMTRHGENYLVMANWEESSAAESLPSMFAFSGNGGSIHFQNANGEEYKTVAYGYALEYGQALNDVMGTEYGDALIDVTKDGAEFLGWTLYKADEISWSNQEVYDTEILCLLYNDSKPEYAHLQNGCLVGEYMPTEQLCGMTAYGENYLAMAIWSE